MKILQVITEEFQAEKIIKNINDKSIIGRDINNNVIFSFNGISDFSQFILENGATFDIEDTITEEQNRADIDYIAVMTGVDL